MYSMLCALEVPHDDAGNPLGATQFANSANAYQRLGPAMRERLGKLRSINSLSGVYASLHRAGAAKQRAPLTEAQKREVEHPVIRTHPVTGEKCVYVSKAATLRILGLSEEESGALIDELSELIVRDDNVYTCRRRADLGQLHHPAPGHRRLRAAAAPFDAPHHRGRLRNLLRKERGIRPCCASRKNSPGANSPRWCW